MKIRLAKKRSKKMLAKIAEHDGVKLKNGLKRVSDKGGFIATYQSFTKDGKPFRFTLWMVKSLRKRGKI